MAGAGAGPRRRALPAARRRPREHAGDGAVARAPAADRQRLQRPAPGVLHGARGHAQPGAVGRRAVDAARPRTSGSSCRRAPLPARRRRPARRARDAGRRSRSTNCAWTPRPRRPCRDPTRRRRPSPGRCRSPAEETLVYQVSWRTSAAMGMSAGTATITAARAPVPGAAPAAAPRATSPSDVQTAAWVARFFEAHDRIETWTDDRLIPIRQEQHLREGRRVVDRATRVRRRLADADGRGGAAAAVAARRARRRQRVLLRAHAAARARLLDRRSRSSKGGRRYTVDLARGPRRADRRSRGRQVEAFRDDAALAASGGGGRPRRVDDLDRDRCAARAAAARGRDGLRLVPHRTGATNRRADLRAILAAHRLYVGRCPRESCRTSQP